MSNRLRQNRGRYGFSLLCLLIILCLGCQPIKIGEPGGMADSSEPVKKSGEIAADEVWSGVVIAESDVIVPKGSALTIRSGTKIKFSRGSKLVVNGSLYAEGEVNRAIAMTSAELEPKPGDWGGIIFSDSSFNSKMEYCFIELHTQIICRSDSLQLTHNVIAQGSVAGIICDSASPTIEDNMITKNGVGIRCEGSASPVISYNAIIANFLDGIECKGSALPTISYSTISNNRKNGITCTSVASPEISYSNIMYNGGWAVYRGGKLISCFVQGNKERGNAIDTNTSLSSDQYYGVESVDSPRSSQVEDAEVRKEERW